MVDLLSYCMYVQKVTDFSFSALINFAMLGCEVTHIFDDTWVVPCDLMRLVS
jgi:hypothetical protein